MLRAKENNVMTKSEFLALVTPVLASYKTKEGLMCHAHVVLLNEVHAAFDDTRWSDCTCICGHCCRTNVGGGNVTWCINPDCDQFQVHVFSSNTQ